MHFATFQEYFPKIAEIETRSVTILEEDSPLQGMFGFIPSFCLDKKCDCRRAIVSVYKASIDSPVRPLATISYGWENMSFYRNWSHGFDNEMLKQFKGPALDIAQPQSPFAEYFLSVFIDNLQKDESYRERFPRHYAYFKRKTGMILPPELKRYIKLFEDCPCGSGRMFKLCCGKARRGIKRRRR